ncbi:hypothetical protein EV175_003302 [Coemansia sp. RSA 1933]|nr:hypothetical protein EV175_003302 [Coemansia sp. RSA 1933]
MLAYPPQTAQAAGVLPKYSLHEPTGHGMRPLIAYLCSSIKRDVRLLAAMGCISEQGAKVIASYLPHGDDASDDAIVRALATHVADSGPLSPESAVAATAAAVGAMANQVVGPDDERRPIAQAKKLNRQRSETAPLRPAQTQKQQTQVRESGSPRKEKQRHEGLGARLGAFFNKLTLDSETSPRTRGTKGSLTPAIGKVAFPQSPGALSFVHSESALVSPDSDDGRRIHERSLSDTLQPAGQAPKLPHRVTVSHCQSPSSDMQQRKASGGSRRSGVSSGKASSSEVSTLASGRTTAASSRSADRTSGASTLANRKRSFTHLGLSMETLPADAAVRPLSSGASGPQLRRAKPATNMAAMQAKLGGPSSPGAVTEGMARLAAPSNSLGLVLQSSSAALAGNKPKPLGVAIRAQRHHSSLSTVKEPRSPTAARIHCGLTSIVQSRSSATPCKSAASSTLAFPPMPSDACQAAMLSAATPQSPPLDTDRRAKATPPAIARALSDSTADAALASMTLVATAAYDYASGIKGDLEFVRGERIVIQSKVNDDWWFGSILPEAGRGSTGRSGMFPRSHVSL